MVINVTCNMPNYANDYNSSLTSGYTVGDTVLNVGSLPTYFPTVLVAGRGTDDETVFQITNGSGGQLTGVSRLRGANVNLAQGTAIEGISVPELWNQYVSAIFDQGGIKNLLYAVDGGSTDDYEITLSTAPSSLADITGVPIVFVANTVNTGASTLDINSLGVKNIKKQGDSALVDLEDGDIQPNQINVVIYDGTQFQLVSSVVNQSIKNYVNHPRVSTEVSSATPTIDTDNVDMHTITALATAITSMTTNLSGTPTNGQKLIIRFKDNGTARAIVWGASFASRGATLPTTTVLSKTTYVGLIWNSTTSTWDCVAVSTEA